MTQEEIFEKLTGGPYSKESLDEISKELFPNAKVSWDKIWLGGPDMVMRGGYLHLASD